MNLSESKTPQGLNPQKVGIEKKIIIIMKIQCNCDSVANADRRML